MKAAIRRLVCTAPLWMCATAFAQSNVTLYGLLDAALDYSSQGGGRLLRVESGDTYGSRWGLKGSEDLGGGLKAIFQLESGFAIDTGTLQQGGRFFGRHSWLGLEGSWGAFTLGRQLSPQFYAFSNTDAFELGNAAGLSVVTKTSAAGTPAFLLGAYVKTGRIDSSVNYATPNVNGFSGRLMLGLSENASGQSYGGSNGASLRYASGPVDLNVGYTQTKDTDAAGAWSVWSAGGSYLVGNAKAFVGYTVDRNTSADTPTTVAPRQEYRLTNVGVRYKVTPLLTAIGQVVRVADHSDALPGDRDATVFGVGFNYDLSKRTALYGSAGTVGNRNGSRYSLGGALYTGGAVTGDARGKTLTVGIRHLF